MSRQLHNSIEKVSYKWSIDKLIPLWRSHQNTGAEKSMCFTLLAESLTHTRKTDTGSMEEIIWPILATSAQNSSFRIYWTVAGRLKLLSKPEKL